MEMCIRDRPKGSRWHLYSWVGIAGNYLLMMFYTTVAGWLLLYFAKMAKGDFAGLDSVGVANEYSSLMQEPGLMTVFMVVVVLLCLSLIHILQDLVCHGVLWCAVDRHKQVSVYQEPPLQHGGGSYRYDYGGDP